LWQAEGQTSEVHTEEGLSDSANFIWAAPGKKLITVTATNAGGIAYGTHTIILSAASTNNPKIYLPLILK